MEKSASLLVLDTNLQALGVVDVYDSLIWTDRYTTPGDFEISMHVNNQNLALLSEENYLWSDLSDHVMIFENRTIETDSESGSRLIVSGRSLESILDRRIVWGQTILSGNLQNCVKSLLNANAINPTNAARKIPNLYFEDSTDPAVTSLRIEAQFTGTNLLEAIQKICESNSIGFKIILDENNRFVFKLYSGVDRSYEQSVNPYVVFSSKFDNILNSNYLESKKTLKTITLVAGEGEGASRRTVTVSCAAGAGSGLARREMFTDARDISSDVDGRTLTTAEYNAQLTQRGAEDLAENVTTQSFEGEVETSSDMYAYDEDFFMGDIVEIVNEYGIEARVRVTEMVMSQSTSEFSTYPTFSKV